MCREISEKILNKNVKVFLLVNLGLFLTGYALVNFLVPAKLAAGGVSGLATIVNYYFKYSVGLTTFVLNIPIFILGVLTFGKKYASKSIYGIVMLSTYITLVEKFMTLQYFVQNSSHNPLVGSIVGGVLGGIGLGLALGLGSNTGGTAIVAQVLNHKLDIKVGTCLIMADTTVITLAAFAFGIKSAILGGASLLLTGYVINMVDSRIKKVYNKEVLAGS